MDGIKLESLYEYKFISNLDYIKEKDKLAFVVSQANEEENKYFSNIFIMDKDGSNLKQMTFDDKVSSFSLIDGDLVFKANRTKKEEDFSKKGFEECNFYKLSLDGGEAEKLFQIPMAVGKIKKYKEDSYIFIGYPNPKKPSLLEINKLEKEEKDKALAQAEKEIEKEKGYERLSHLPFWVNGGGFNDGQKANLYLYNKKTDQIKRLLPEDVLVSSFELVEDKAYIIYDYEASLMKLNSLAGILDIESGDLKEIYNDDNIRFDYLNQLEGEIFAAITDMTSQGINGDSRFVLVKDGKLEDITPKDFSGSLFMEVNSDSRLYGSRSFDVINNRCYFISTKGVDTRLYSIDKSGTCKVEIDKAGSVDGFALGKEEIFAVAFRENRLQEIYSYKEDQERKLTSFNDSILEKYALSTPEHILLKNGYVELDGYIMRPIGFKEGEKYKTILEIHGGPKTTYSSIFFSEMQYLAGLGYVVIFTNPRGSDGKGFEFSDIRGKYGTIDYEDIMFFTKEIIKKYDFIDQEKIGVTGGSYGGYITNWIVGHTDFFKAAVTQRSISNWISKFNTTDIGYYFVKDQVGFTPWENMEKLWDNSPLKYADQVKTPTLVIHSEEDLRCDVDQGYQWYSALKYHGVDAEMLMIRGENHELSRGGRPQQRIERLKAIGNWFEEKL